MHVSRKLALDQQKSIDEAFDCGGNDYVMKPFDYTMIRRQLELGQLLKVCSA